MNPFRSVRQSAPEDIDLIPPSHAVRRGMENRPAARRDSEIVDAEFEVVRSPRLASRSVVNDNLTRSSAVASPGAPVSRFARPASAVAGLEEGLKLLPRKGFFGLAVFVCVCVFLSVYFYWPANRANPVHYGSNGLVISRLHQSPVDANGFRVIELTGVVENRSASPEKSPAVIAELISDGRAVGRAAVSLGDTAIGAGKSAVFVMRIPYPGGKQPKVKVSFAAKGV